MNVCVAYRDADDDVSAVKNKPRAAQDRSQKRLHHNMRITSHCLVFGHSHTSQYLTHTDVHISIYL